MALTACMEDYLEAIYAVDRERSAVRVRDVARRLGVTMPSVTGALKTLEAGGLIRHERYEFIELTRAGEALARKITARHRTILMFLNGVIGVDHATAEIEACGIEHILSAETMEKLTGFIARTLDESQNRHKA